ncbi:MAG: glycosyltransferase [Bacillus sp. (in: Bacteria)]|nr:glycosyltransferase [Bacillus sp. (in: firmicutes)]
MKIIFLQSSYRGIYPYLERAIIQAFQKQKVDVITVPHPIKVSNIIELIKKEQPDCVFSLIGRKNRKLLQLLQHIPVKKVGWFLEDPYFMEETIPFTSVIDIVFTVEENAQKIYEEFGHNHSHYLPLGYDDSVYYQQMTLNTDFHSNICLVGFPYSQRVELVKQITKKTKWDLLVIGQGWARETKNWKNRPRMINRWISPEQVAIYYSNSKLILNPHREVVAWNKQKHQQDLASSPNNRTFEAAACNTLQITNYRAGISHLFHSHCSIPMYSSIRERLEMIDSLLNNEKERNSEAKKAADYVQMEHTFANRIKTIKEIILSHRQ